MGLQIVILFGPRKAQEMALEELRTKGASGLQRRVSVLDLGLRVYVEGLREVGLRIGGSFEIRVPFGVLFTRVPYYIGDLRRDPNF